MVFGGYADDLRTRPSAITSLSKMPRIRVLVIGHGLCPARELARSLNASAFLVTYLVELPTSRLLARHGLRLVHYDSTSTGHPENRIGAGSPCHAYRPACESHLSRSLVEVLQSMPRESDGQSSCSSSDYELIARDPR